MGLWGCGEIQVSWVPLWIVLAHGACFPKRSPSGSHRSTKGRHTKWKQLAWVLWMLLFNLGRGWALFCSGPCPEAEGTFQCRCTEECRSAPGKGGRYCCWVLWSAGSHWHHNSPGAPLGWPPWSQEHTAQMRVLVTECRNLIGSIRERVVEPLRQELERPSCI